MNLFLTSFESVAVLLGIGLVGFYIIKRKIVKGDALKFLSPLVLEIALPCLIFINIIQGFSPQENQNWWHLPLWWLLFTAIAAVFTALFMFLSKKDTRKEFAASLFYHNGIFFPLAIIAGMFPSEPSYLVLLFLFTLLYPAFFFNTFRIFFKDKNQPLNIKKIFHPVLLATLLAIVIRLGNGHQYIPEFALSIVQLLGGMTIPLIMILLGGNIYIDFHKKGVIHTTEIIKFVAIKNFVFPLIFLAIIKMIQPDYFIALLLLIQSAVPPVTAVPLLTERVGGNRTIVNQFIVASFLVSLGSIPLMIWLFDIFFSM